jgi:hypothetical protein
MSGTNGKSVVIPEQSTEREPYRPSASREKVHDTIVGSLSQIVSESTYQAGNFVSLAEHYDRDKGTAVRYGHLVDADECLELALTYLGMLKQVLAHRMRIEDDENTGSPGF